MSKTTTLEDLAGLWCELWQAQLGRGEDVDEEYEGILLMATADNAELGFYDIDDPREFMLDISVPFRLEGALFVKDGEVSGSLRAPLYPSDNYDAAGRELKALIRAVTP